MSHSVAEKEPSKADDSCPIPPAQPEEPKINFPKVDGPAAFYDDVDHVAWVAVPFDKVFDPNYVMASLDRAKFDVLNYLGSYLRDRRLRDELASKTKVKTGIFAKLGIH